MNNLKGFYVKNKQLIMLTASVVIGIFLIFTVIAVIISNKGNGETVQTDKTTTTNKNTTVAEATTEEIVVSTTPDNETAALQDETTAEPETERETIDPYSLPYKIRVNRAANCITVYGKDGSGQFNTPIKAITCSTGKEVGDTPAGTFTTLISYKWLLMVDGSYGQYAYRFYGPILFHSVPYYSKDKGDLEWEQFNKLGEAASLGCVRVTVADAIWLIDNCPIGTLVEVYDDAANPGPLGKPDTIKIPADSPYKGWDPTDPDVNNPWHHFKPEIKTKKIFVTVETGSTMDDVIEALGVKAYDTCGNEITSKLQITEADLNTVGTYTVKLNVTDAIGKTAEEVVVEVNVIKEETTTPKPTTTPEKPTEETTDDETEDMSDETTDESVSGETGTSVKDEEIDTSVTDDETEDASDVTSDETPSEDKTSSDAEGSSTTKQPNDTATSTTKDSIFSEENTTVPNDVEEGESN